MDTQSQSVEQSVEIPIPDHIKSYRHTIRHRPRVISSVDEMIARCDDYFMWADYMGYPYTIPDLALYLGFHCTQSLVEYEGYSQEFFVTLKTAKLAIEAQRTRALITCKTSPVGMIFDLKNNFGWKDVTEIQHTGNIQLSSEQVDKKLEVLLTSAFKLGILSAPALQAGEGEVDVTPDCQDSVQSSISSDNIQPYPDK